MEHVNVRAAYRCSDWEYEMPEENAPQIQPLDTEKHVSQIGDLLILLALMRDEPETLEEPEILVDGLRVVELLKRFHIDMDHGYIRKRHHAKPGLFGKQKGGMLRIPAYDSEISSQLAFLCQAVTTLSNLDEQYMRIPATPGNYYTWTPSSFAVQAATEEEREAYGRYLERSAEAGAIGKMEEERRHPAIQTATEEQLEAYGREIEDAAARVKAEKERRCKKAEATVRAERERGDARREARVGTAIEP